MNFTDKVKKHPVKAVFFSLLILLAACILFGILRETYYYNKYKARDVSPIEYNKTFTNEIDLVLTKYILEKCENKLNIKEGIEKLTNEEVGLINEIGAALCNFDKFTSDDKLKDKIVAILEKHKADSLTPLKNQINSFIDGKKFDTKDNRLEKQKVKPSNKEDTKDFSRYLPIEKKNKGSSYGFIMKKTICGKISNKDANKKYLESKYININFYKQDFENEYEIAYGIAKDTFKEKLNFGLFYLTKITRNNQMKEMKGMNFDLQNASKNEYLMYKLFKIIDPEKYQNLKERKIIGKKGIIVKLIPTIKKKLSEASPKEMIRCFIESMIVELDDLIKSDNYISTDQGVLNIDFGIRSDIARNKIQRLIEVISKENGIKYFLENVIDDVFPRAFKVIDTSNQMSEIIDAMNNAIEKIKDDEIIEILNDLCSQDKYNAMKKVCDDEEEFASVDIPPQIQKEEILSVEEFAKLKKTND